MPDVTIFICALISLMLLQFSNQSGELHIVLPAMCSLKVFFLSILFYFSVLEYTIEDYFVLFRFRSAEL